MVSNIQVCGIPLSDLSYCGMVDIDYVAQLKKPEKH